MSTKRWLPLCMLVLGALAAQSALAGRLVDLNVFDRADNRRLPVYRQATAGSPDSRGTNTASSCATARVHACSRSSRSTA